jgi:short-subunit dehydrogenase
VTTLRGKIALLTGGSRGIGPYIGRALAREGVHLVLTARSGPELQRVADDLSALGIRAVGVTADITDAVARQRLVARAHEEFGHIDILINNAGVERVVAFAAQEPSDVIRILTTNLEAPLLLSQDVLRGMLARGSGHIVTISSMNGQRGVAYHAVYSASKAGLIEWTSAVRVELETSGVRASVICPGLVSRAGMWASHQRAAPWLARESTPEQVAGAVLSALKNNRAEINVNPLPVWPFLVLRSMSLDLANAVARRIGLVDLARRVAEEPRAAPPRRPC